MNILFPFLITLASVAFCIFVLYLYLRKSGSKLDYIKARNLFRCGRYDESEVFFKRALGKTKKNDPIHLSSLMGLYEVYAKLSKIELSSKTLDKALEVSRKKEKWIQLYKQILRIKENTSANRSIAEMRG